MHTEACINFNKDDPSMELKEKCAIYTTLSVTINGKTHFLGYDLTPKGIGTNPLTEEKYRKCLKGLIPAMLRVLSDHNKLIETSQRSLCN